ncbi:tetratricopeptide repeat protein, partial [bacterium]|nr:tetratricopeptide repeat protein [bacterium]
FLKLYLRVGHQRQEEGDQRDALAMYRRYLELEPARSEVSQAVVAQLHLAVARADFAHGDAARALPNLVGARPVYRNDPEFNNLYGTVLALLGRFEEALPCFDRAVTAKPAVSGYYARRGLLQILWALHIEQTAVEAFAGLLDSPADLVFQPLLPASPRAPVTEPAAGTNDRPPDTETAYLDGGTNPPDAWAGAAQPAGTGPVFATVLPPTITGGRPDLQLAYDALASRDLFSETIDLIDQVHALGNETAPASPAGGGDRGSSLNTPRQVEERNRLERIRTSFELGNSLSTVHQRVLDHNGRKERLARSLRRMAILFANGNRDLAQAIQLGADRSAGLIEILRATRQHEPLAAVVATKITPYLTAEMEVINRAYHLAENGYRNLSAKHFLPPATPMAGLDMVFSRLFDRRSFDEGLQALRRAGAIRVPLELVPLPGAKTLAETDGGIVAAEPR